MRGICDTIDTGLLNYSVVFSVKKDYRRSNIIYARWIISGTHSKYIGETRLAYRRCIHSRPYCAGVACNETVVGTPETESDYYPAIVGGRAHISGRKGHQRIGVVVTRYWLHSIVCSPLMHVRTQETWVCDSQDRVFYCWFILKQDLYLYRYYLALFNDIFRMPLADYWTYFHRSASVRNAPHNIANTN